MKEQALHLERLKAVYNALGPLGKKVVFVGGATVFLYATNPAAEEVRPTEDVDLVVGSATYGDYAALEDTLRQLGFSNDQQSGIICRYVLGGLIVDVMPAEGSFLGFQNRWYSEGFKESVLYHLDAHTTIRILSSPYFLASKLEAFAGRGQNDGRSSSDFEDIVYILNNRDTVWEECTQASEDVRKYLQERFEHFLLQPFFEEWIYGHLEPAFAAQYLKKILVGMQEFVYRER